MSVLNAYFHADDALVVNRFVASEVVWKRGRPALTKAKAGGQRISLACAPPWSHPAILRSCRRDRLCWPQCVRSRIAAAAASIEPALQTAPAASTPPSYPGYSLAWADEFDGTGEPDPKRWTYERGFVRNRELQWYQPQNARQADGLLIIEARRERVANPGYEAGAGNWQRSREFAEYSSASVTTRGLHSWRYGRSKCAAASIRGLDCGRRSGPWASPATGAQRRDRHHGRTTAASSSPMSRGAVRSASRRSGPIRASHSPASRPLTGPTAFMSGAWTGTSAPSSCRWTANV